MDSESSNHSKPNAGSILNALGSAFASPMGDPMPNEKMVQVIAANMAQLKELVSQGKLGPQQILQLKEFADKRPAAAAPPPPPPAPPAPAPATAPASSSAAPAATSAAAAFKTTEPTPILNSAPGVGYPISQTLSSTDPGPVTWPASQHGRPTLTGGTAGGRVSGTPAQIRGLEDVNLTALDDARVRRKSTPGDQSMRRSIQDLVSSIDPNVKIEPDVEDLLLSIADEFVDSVTNFACRLAKHRGGDTLEVKDLQLHLERNHNIRIPGFAADETRLSLSQSNVPPPAPAPATTKKGAQGSHMTLRSHRLLQVQQAKRDAKLL